MPQSPLKLFKLLNPKPFYHASPFLPTETPVKGPAQFLPSLLLLTPTQGLLHVGPLCSTPPPPLGVVSNKLYFQ